MSEEEAYAQFKAIRWAETAGNPVCPKCDCSDAYESKTRKIFKCRDCARQFSVTSGTIFASRKLPMRDLLAAIAIFVNGVKGVSALQMSRELGVDYKTAFVLAHKLREAMTSLLDTETPMVGHVEIDGAYYGGYVKPLNRKRERRDRRTKLHRNGKRRPVVVIRERGGRVVTVVAQSESGAVPYIQKIVSPEATVYADEATDWNRLEMTHNVLRINHQIEYANGAVSTNHAESFHSRMRRSEKGIHHHFSGCYLAAYAQEAGWREAHRRASNGEQYLAIVAATAAHPVSRQWKGYWQRSAAT